MEQVKEISGQSNPEQNEELLISVEDISTFGSRDSSMGDSPGDNND